MLIKLTMQIVYLSVVLIMIAEALKGLEIKSILKIIIYTFLIGFFINYIFYGISIQTTFEVCITMSIIISIFYIIKLIKMR